jgi:uncharacterized protein YkuJ
VGTELTVQQLIPPDPDSIDPMSHFIDKINEILDCALYNRDDFDMVGITITNDQNGGEKAAGISFRRKDQLFAEAIWRVFEKVIQYNARFNALDKLTIEIYAVQMPSGSVFAKEKGKRYLSWRTLKKVSCR